jgi:Siphovirus Gp157
MRKRTMSTIAATNSLFEIDAELDGLLDEIEEQTEQKGEPPEELVARFQQFCSAHGEKVDRIGRFLRQMEAREQFCRSEAARLADRARATAGKVERTKNMVLYYLLSRDLKKIEGYQFTLRAQKNSQDSVRIIDEAAVPKSYCRIDARIDGVLWETVLSLLPDELSRSLESSVQEARPNADAIKAAAMRNEQVPGAEVRRGSHLRVA